MDSYIKRDTIKECISYVQNFRASGHEDWVKLLTNSILCHYFPLDRYVVGPEQEREGNRADFNVFTLEQTGITSALVDRITVECKRYVKFEKNAEGNILVNHSIHSNVKSQLSLACDEAINSNYSCYGIIIIGTLIKFYEYYHEIKTDNYENRMELYRDGEGWMVYMRENRVPGLRLGYMNLADVGDAAIIHDTFMYIKANIIPKKVNLHIT
nr:hypothetical protein [Morchella crassipes]